MPGDERIQAELERPRESERGVERDLAAPRAGLDAADLADRDARQSLELVLGEATGHALTPDAPGEVAADAHASMLASGSAPAKMNGRTPERGRSRFVDQTVFTFPGGNCFSACVASLLRLGLDAVPYFMGDGPMDELERDGGWFDRFTAWLAPHGFFAVYFRLDEQGVWHPPGLHILSGRSPRAPKGKAWQHSVVARGREILHDPHPSRAGILSHDDVVLLVPLDPGGQT